MSIDVKKRIQELSFLRLFLLAILLLGSVAASSQVTVVVNKIPENTPPGDSLFIVGNFNDWNPGDSKFMLDKKSDGSFSITLPKESLNLEFKITRGSWPSVEGDINGKKTNDRKLTALKGTPITHYIQILSWEDLGNNHNWNIFVKSIPSNTPYEAPIYISGSFNEWRENDPDFKLTKLDDGTYAVKIPKAERDTIWYKFHRGNWSTVESRANGRTMFNRISAWNQGQSSTAIECKIAAWEDLASGSNLFYTFILLATAIQGVLIILSVLAIRNRNNKTTQVLILLMLVTSVTLIARLATYNRIAFDWQPKLLLLSDLIYFLYAPLLYLLVKRITGITTSFRILQWTFIVAFATQIILYTPLLMQPREEFIINNIDGRFDRLFNWTCIVAMVYSAVVWFIALRLLIRQKRIEKSLGFGNSFSYAITIMVHSAICLIIWIIAVIVLTLAPVFHYDAIGFHETAIDFVWIFFALSTYTHTFLVIRKPELFKVKDETEEKKIGSHQKENIEALKTSLNAVMKKQKPFLNSKLALQDLAELTKTNGHTLSWLINEGYNKNFFDFVNEYRIEEFKRLVASDQYKNYTFLAIAMEVGFSSKTTFNRAFKKSTGKTPREFFNNVQESQLEGISE
jgi:AraC-like DNA-binding protein